MIWKIIIYILLGILFRQLMIYISVPLESAEYYTYLVPYVIVCALIMNAKNIIDVFNNQK